MWLLELHSFNQGFDVLRTISPQNWLGISYLVIGPSVLSYWLWNKGLGILGTARGSLFNHAIPLSSAILAILFLKESLHSYHIVSLLLIASGILMANKTSSHHRKVSLN